MTYSVFVKPEALDDFYIWLKNKPEEINPWLEVRIRIVTQSVGGWVQHHVDSLDYFFIKDTCGPFIIYKNGNC